MKTYNAHITGSHLPHKINGANDRKLREWVLFQLPGVLLPEDLPSEKMVIEYADYQLSITPLDSSPSEPMKAPVSAVTVPDADLVTERIKPLSMAKSIAPVK